MPLSRRESLQAESERSHLVPRVEERNRTRSADAIHAYSSQRETNRATETRSIGGIQARADEYSALTTYYCLLRGVFWGADFTQTENGLRGKLALSNGGRHRASAAREVVMKSSFAEEAPLS
jgi:hypothetical protein